MHRIRLGSAWRLHMPSRSAGTKSADAECRGTKFDLPARGELLRDVADDCSFELHRSFNQPSNLDDEQRVTLVFTGLATGARIMLNDSVLSATPLTEPSDADAISFEVRGKLRSHNELIIAFSNRAAIRPDTIILAAAMLGIESGPGNGE